MKARQRSTLMIIVGLAFFIQTIDATVLNTSFPQIAYAFHIDPIHLKMAITSYLVSVGLLIPTCSYLSSKIGIKKLYLSACLIFMAASIGCACSYGLVSLVVFRAVSGKPFFIQAQSE